MYLKIMKTISPIFGCNGVKFQKTEIFHGDVRNAKSSMLLLAVTASVGNALLPTQTFTTNYTMSWSVKCQITVRN